VDVSAWTIGVDPGLTGAVAILDQDEMIEALIDMPNAGGHVMAADLAKWVRAHSYVHMVAWIEDVHAMPGQGVSSTFKFGRSVGVVAGVLGALDIPIRWVSPAKWKGAMGLSKDKGASRRRAQELWPTHAATFSRVRDDGRAEAALIAAYGRRQA
jgi:crossover junction endodeoxyribonuclease RuvC